MGRISSRDCKSVEGQQLKLVIDSVSEDAMVMELQNTNHSSEKWYKIKTFAMLVAFLVFSSSMQVTNVFIFAIASVLLLINTFLLISLVDKETVTIVRNVSFQKTTRKAFGFAKTSTIACSSLKGIVINEVFDDRRVIFLLQLITQGGSKDHSATGIVPLFENLKPNRECLEHVYKILKSKLRL